MEVTLCDFCKKQVEHDKSGGHEFMIKKHFISVYIGDNGDMGHYDICLKCLKKWLAEDKQHSCDDCKDPSVYMKRHLWHK